MTAFTTRPTVLSRRTLLALGGAGLLAAAGAGRAWAQNVEELKIQLNWLETRFAPFFAAEKIGSDTANGIKQTFIPGGPQVDPVQSTAAGTGEVGFAGTVSQVALARSNGIPVKMIGALFRSSPLGLISLADNPIKTMQDAVGKRIGLQGGARLAWSIMMKEAGLTEDQMTIVPVAGDITPLISKQVDGFWGTAVNQHLTLKLQGIDNYIMTRNESGAPEHFGVIMAMENVIVEKADKLSRWFKAVLAGFDYAIANTEETADYIVARSPSLNLKQEQVREQVKRILTFVNPANLPIRLLEIDEAGAAQAIEQIAGMDMLPTPVTLADLYDRSILDKAYA